MALILFNRKGAIQLPIIVIDPGHGGRDCGATSRGTHEKDLTLKISLQLRDILARCGFQVVMTRVIDRELGSNVSADLAARCHIANQAQPDAILSIHINAGGGRGAEIYVHKDGGAIRPLAQGIVTNVATVMDYHGKPIKASYEAPDGGLALVDRTHAPAMLLEIGYIDSDDLPKMLANIDQFAPLLAKAICAHYGVAYADQSKEDEYMLNPNDANKVIGFLKAAHAIATTDADRKEYGRLADELRKASGQPTQNS